MRARSEALVLRLSVHSSQYETVLVGHSFSYARRAADLVLVAARCRKMHNLLVSFFPNFSNLIHAQVHSKHSLVLVALLYQRRLLAGSYLVISNQDA